MTRCFGLSLIVAIALSTSAYAAGDEYEIQASSNAPGHPVGQKLAKGARLTLPPNGTISFFDRTASSGPVTRTCAGKYEGPIEACRAGRTGTSSTVPGATRGAVR